MYSVEAVAFTDTTIPKEGEKGIITGECKLVVNDIKIEHREIKW